MNLECKEILTQLVLKHGESKNKNDAFFLIEKICTTLEKYGYTDSDWWAED